MKPSQRQWSWILLTTCAALVSVALAHAQQSPDRGASSYMPVDIKEPFAAVMARMKAAQPDIQKRQADLLAERYDLADVAQGKLVTIDNYYELFNGILNPKQLEGLRLLLTPFAQQQFNQTEDRRSEKASRGVACFDCHANGHSNGATHESGDVRPQQHRRRIDTPPLRGVNIQRLFGSQRALKTVEDFTEFEQRGAYFDGDMVIAFSNAAIRSTSWPSSRRCWDSRRRRSSTCWESSIRARPPPPSCAGRRSSSARANAVPAT